jgi:ferrous iron transport protein A
MTAKTQNLAQRRLSEITTGKQATLASVQVGRELTSRLTSLGLTPGVRVQVLQNHGHGPLIVNVRGTNIALGRGEADKLLVEPCEDVV